MEKVQELRNTKVFNLFSQILLIAFLIVHAYEILLESKSFSNMSMINLVDVALEAIAIVFTLVTVIMNLLKKTGDSKITIIALAIPLISRGFVHFIYYSNIWDSMASLFIYALIPTVLYIVMVVVMCSYISKPKKGKMITANVLAGVNVLSTIMINNLARYTKVSDIEMILAFVILVFIVIVFNISYKRKKMVANDNLGKNAEIAETASKASNNHTAEAIKQYKELLDIGAISQAEYEEKKKELLNL